MTRKCVTDIWNSEWLNAIISHPAPFHPSVQEAVGKTVTSLRRLGVVEGGGRNPIARCPSLEASPLVTAWLVHAVMLSRQVESIEVLDAAGAPELFWADQSTPDPDYPHLELHTEGLNRWVWVST